MVSEINYKNVPMAQKLEALDMLKSLMIEFKPEILIEIGTYCGGLSLFLSELNLCEIHTFDIEDRNPNLSKNDKLVRNFMDAFSNECKNHIRNLTSNKRTMWLFDGGDKKREVLFYKDICKPGELVMSHDFAPDYNSFDYLRKNNIWLWWESDATCFPLSEFKQHQNFEEIWKTCVWGAYIKQ